MDDYTFWAFVFLCLVVLWCIFGLLSGQPRFQLRLARFRNQGRFTLISDMFHNEDSGNAFVRDHQDGLSSQNFDVSINIDEGDSRPGLDSEEVRRIMETQGVSFDNARLIRQKQLMERNNIDPSTGMPLDPKAVSFSRR
ncbi:hypothetical protein GGI07_005551 [Coemansia sp. Benny D115]|nr:hypothetical protein GGI07_005551 [Coemansia sp. Benny D115]